jgi:hypothetical protein
MSTKTQKKHKKAVGFLRWSILIVFLMVVVSGMLLQSRSARSIIFKTAIKLPEYGFFVMLRRGIYGGRNFELGNVWLNRQLDLVQKYSSGRNPLLLGLIYNSEYMMQRALFRYDFIAVRPFLERMVSLYPEMFLPRLWLGRAIEHSDPKGAIEQLKEAVRLSASDERPYRVAMAIALREKNSLMQKEWCFRYSKAQLGGPQDIQPVALFNGLGLRKLAIEVIDAEGRNKVIATTGLKLKEKRSYDFTFKESMFGESLRLHFGVVPGVSISISRVRIFRSGKLVSDFENNLMLSSRNGFHLSDGSILSTNKDGEIVTIYPPGEDFGDLDRVVVDIYVKRLGLATPDNCGEGK